VITIDELRSPSTFPPPTARRLADAWTTSVASSLESPTENTFPLPAASNLPKKAALGVACISDAGWSSLIVRRIAPLVASMS
jgi:hypothetical protein